jgi:sirohydrochlorin ferrochelatase
MPTRGRADPVSVEGEIDTPSGTEYLPEDHAVRYVAYLSARGEDPPERESAYETLPFERWARTEAASFGKERVTDAVESELGENRRVGYAVGQHEEGVAVVVEIGTMRDRDGTVISEPTIEYDRLCDLTPESVTATVRFAGQAHTETFPVVVSETEGQLL